MVQNKFYKAKSRLNLFVGRPDLTPLVDVLFLLLIFFMLSSSFVQVSGIKVDVPSVGAQSTMGIEKFVVTVTRNAGSGYEVSFNDRPVSWELLKEELASVSVLSRSATVIVRADKSVEFGVVARIMALAENANLSVFIVTVAPGEKRDAVFVDSGE